jgi:CBS domain-containing protein
MPAAALNALSAATEVSRLLQPVTAVMWSPVPSTAPDTDLRRVAALLLDTGLPGVPVADRSGAVIGFVSRTDLLRALATDPPLDLWS